MFNILDYGPLTALFVPFIFLTVYFILFKKHNESESPPPDGVFYPPDGFNSAEVGFLHKGKADGYDVVSLLLYLAAKGYVEITEPEKASVFSPLKNYKITKIKGYDGRNMNEGIFIGELFSDKLQYNLRDVIKLIKNPEQAVSAAASGDVTEVETWRLNNRFYAVVNRIKMNLNTRENRKKIVKKSPITVAFGVLAILISFLFITVKPVLEFYDEPQMLIFALTFPALGLWMILGAITGFISPRDGKWALILFGGVFGGFPWAFIVLPALLANTFYLAAYAAGIICITGIMFLMKKVTLNRTPYGREMLSKTKGLINFLKTAENHQLEDLLKRDPGYFYNMLPYAYALNITDVWLLKFNELSLSEPAWRSASYGDAAPFPIYFKAMTKHAYAVMTSRPSKNSD